MGDQLYLKFGGPFDIQFGVKHVNVRVDYVLVNGTEFELYDLLETLQNVKDDDVMITNTKMGKFLKSIEVLKSLGSNRGGYGAEPGPRFGELFEALEKKINEEGE